MHFNIFKLVSSQYISIFLLQDDYYGDLNIESANSSLNNSKKNLMDHFRSPGRERKSAEVTSTPPTGTAAQSTATKTPDATETPATQTPDATITPDATKTTRILDLRSLKATLVKAKTSSSQRKLSQLQKKEISLRNRVGVETDEARAFRKKCEEQNDRRLNRSPGTPDTPESERKALRKEVSESFSLKRHNLFPKSEIPESKRPALIDLRARDREDIIAHNASFKKPAPRPKPAPPPPKAQTPLQTPLAGQKLLPPLKRSYDHYQIQDLIIEDDIPKGMTKHRVFQHLPYSRIKPTQYIAYEHPAIPRVLRIGVVGEVPKKYDAV